MCGRAPRAPRREPPADRVGRAAARARPDRADRRDGRRQDRPRPCPRPPARRAAAARHRPAGRERGVRRGGIRLVCGALLIGLSTWQGEFDYSVPQFRLVLHPIMLMLAASVALVAARIYLGRGGALLAAIFFLLVRGALTLLVSPLF